MPNSIQLAQRYLPILDEIYKANSLTSFMDTANERVRFIGANTVQLYKSALDGLGDYSRADGFVNGSITGSWEALTLTQDRGRSFNIDVMDNDETLGMALGTTVGEFVRTKVIPEIDAYRFAKFAGTSGVDGASADIASGADVIELIDAAQASMDDNEVPYEGRVLFVNPTVYAYLKQNIQRRLINEVVADRNVVMLDNMRVISVPVSRFNTAITLLDGGSGETAGGYAVPTGSYKINFMIVHPSAVVQVAKHVAPRLFGPDMNLDADAWKFNYRIYHDAFVEDNKVKGIYVHKAATAN